MSGETISVITISRQYGSGGAAVAAEVAARLGFKLLDKDLIASLARSARVDPAVAERLDERLDPWLHRLARPLWRGGFEGVAAVSEADVVDADRAAALTRRIVEEAAELGRCVIVGRGSACALAGRKGALHVFVYAPRPERVRNLRGRLGPGADVESAMDATDRERAAYVKRHFGREWRDPELYHLMINSALGVDAAVAVLLGALDALEARG